MSTADFALTSIFGLYERETITWKYTPNLFLSGQGLFESLF
jgi:hypothetical protein